jgi:hypothetical protein
MKGQSQVFNLVIYAVVAVAVLAILLQILGTLVFQPNNLIEIAKQVSKQAYQSAGSKICSNSSAILPAGTELCKATITEETSVEKVEFKINHPHLTKDGDCVKGKSEKSDVKRIRVCAQYLSSEDKMIIYLQLGR